MALIYAKRRACEACRAPAKGAGAPATRAVVPDGTPTPPPGGFAAGLDAAQASATHFLVKLVLAAPASFFSAALASHAAVVSASVSHFLTKLVLAAPASFFSVALASHAASRWRPHRPRTS